MTEVTVIGLGPMGFALADLVLKAGNSVTLWNRSPEKATGLVERGAKLAATPAAAIAASPTALVCVYDYHAVEAILATDSVPAAIRGRLIVNLGTGSPEDASRTETSSAAIKAAISMALSRRRPARWGRTTRRFSFQVRSPTSPRLRLS